MDDVEPTARKLKAKGVEFLMEPKEALRHDLYLQKMSTAIVWC
jgi:hypothetical protein